ncbi:MAG: isopentenyl-diphosphate Delta-isomerase [Flavobacteriaceae bacterium]|nr:isopentenyl-diphosphate Delta-isomerase [Flavobacteriaceae bacterium]
MQNELVTLVDADDRKLGTMDKLLAHVQGRLHRAFSVLVFNSNCELLMQQRSEFKYHSAYLWTNTCCSHPRPGEDVKAAAHRRLMEEMGLDCELELKSKFVYKCDFDEGLHEHELDYVLTSISDSTPNADPNEVKSWKWMSVEDIEADLKLHPEEYTFWFKEMAEKGLLHKLRSPVVA